MILPTFAPICLLTEATNENIFIVLQRNVRQLE